jgi:periplasmic binding family protein
MGKYSKVAVAVAAALGSGVAVAANPTWSTSLVIAGSSAMRDAVANEMQTVLCGSGFTSFVSQAGAGGSFDTPDFRAYTCTLSSSLPSPLGGASVIVYYRSEGGSIFGVFGNSVLNGGTSLQINRLNPGPSGGTECSDGGGVLLGISQPTSATVTADTQNTTNGSCVTKDTVQLGISDVEPAAFVGENYGSEYTFVNYPQPTVSQLNSLDKGTLIGEAYAAIVSNQAGGTAIFNTAGGFATTGLTTQELATIFAGKTTDWGNVPSAKALGTAGGAITLCRREPGSGTQTVTSTHFLGTTCGAAGVAFDTPTSGNGNTVIEGFATSDVLTCVQNHAGSIGLVTLQTAAKITGANATQITLDGVQGTAITAAQDQYRWYGEAYYVKNDSSLPAGSVQLALANKIISDLQSAQNTPTSAVDPNIVALPKYNTPFSPVTPLKTGQKIPIAIGSTNGSTCAPLINEIG